MTKKDENLIIRCTSAEKKKWNLQCKQYGLNYSDLIREALKAFNPQANDTDRVISIIETRLNELESNIEAMLHSFLDNGSQKILESIIVQKLSDLIDDKFRVLADTMIKN